MRSDGDPLETGSKPIRDRIRSAVQRARGSRPVRLALKGLAAVLLAVLAVTAVRAWTDSDSSQNEDNVVRQWNAAIARLGIEPVYPPQEDIAVGDIFLVIARTRASPEEDSELPQSLQGRALKLWHVDLTDALDKIYSRSYSFPDTADKPEDGVIWVQKGAEGSVFKTGVARTHLPIVLFPELTITSAREASTAGSLAPGWIGGIFGVGGVGERKTELRISAAEAYGVPHLVALGALEGFCRDPVMRTYCTQNGARRALSSLVGRAIYETSSDKQGDGRASFRYDVEIMMVSHVFMTRALETTTHASNRLAIESAIGPQVNSALQRLGEAIPSESAEVTEEDVDRLRQILQDEQRRLGRAVSEGAAPGSGVTAGARAVDSYTVTATQILQRPVVIGFRSARRILEESQLDR